MYKIFDEFGISSSYSSPRGAARGLVWNRIPEEPDEGITGQKDADGNALTRAVSITEVKITDVLCEGEIEGLVEGEYEGIASGGIAGSKGQVGWDSVKYHEFANIKPNADDLYSGVQWLPSVFYDDVPILNTISKFNFQQFQIKQSKGTPDGVIDDGINNPLTIHRQIGERLRGGGKDFAKTYRINNPNCKGIAITIKVVSLSVIEKKDKDKYGDKEDTSVDYHVEYRPVFTTESGALHHGQTFLPIADKQIKGYINSPYLHQTTVKFSQDFSNIVGFIGWEIRVYRDTEDSLTTTISNQTYIDGFYEVYGNIFTYPNTAMIEHKFLAEYFGSDTPKRYYDIRGLKVKLPIDYDPISKTYHGGQVGYSYWDGTFKTYKQWTDNPAWIFYDLMTNRRYGLGQYIHPDFIDKWTLYEIAKYCDELVEDGYGGLEPRFTCGMTITNRDAAYKVVQDLASIFRAITYFQGGSIYLSQDAKKNAIYQFTNANVKEGDFIYQSTASRARRTVGIVRYRNKKEDFKQAVEYVEDIDGIRKFGIREIEVAGVGITSRGQAIRYGRWMLLSEQMDKESVSFTTGMEATILKPGDIISIQDQYRGTKRYGGRLSAISNSGDAWDPTARFKVWNSTVTLDTEVPLGVTSADTYDFVLLTPSYQYDASNTQITSVEETDNIRRSQLQTRSFNGSQVSVNSEGKTVITFQGTEGPQSSGFAKSGYEYSNDLVWAIEPTGNTKSKFSEKHNAPSEWKVLNVSERENEYSVSCLEYNNKKFDMLENTIDFDDENANPNVVPPTAIIMGEKPVTANTKELTWTISPGSILHVKGYYVYIKQGAWNGADFVETEPGRTAAESALGTTPDSKYLVRVHTGAVGDLAGDNYYPSADGTYHVRCYSFNIAGRASDSSAEASIPITGVNPIFDTHIRSLTISSSQSDFTISGGEIDPGTRGERTHDEAEPIFVWGITVAGREDPNVRFNYRITIRDQSNTNIPHSNIILTYQGHNSSSTSPTSSIGQYVEDLNNAGPGEFAFQLDIDKNIDALSSSRPYLRHYDVVVEAINDAGVSSAGTITSSSVQNPFGYDILEVNNPKIGQIDMTPPDELDVCIQSGGQGGSSFCSDQYMDLAGNVYISYSDQSPDITTQDFTVRAGILLISKTPFVTRNGGIPDVRLKDAAYRESLGIQVVGFINNSNAPNKINIIAGFVEKEAYIAVAYSDDYDSLLRSKKGNEYVVELLFDQITNVQQIEVRSSVMDLIGSGLFRAFLAGEWTGLGGTISNIRASSNMELVSSKKYSTWNPGGNQGGHSKIERTYLTRYKTGEFLWHDRHRVSVRSVNYNRWRTIPAGWKMWGRGRASGLLHHDRHYGSPHFPSSWESYGEDGYSLLPPFLDKVSTPSLGLRSASNGSFEMEREYVWTLFFKFVDGDMPHNRYFVFINPPIMWSGSTSNPHPVSTVGVRYFDQTTDPAYVAYAIKADHVNSNANSPWQGRNRGVPHSNMDPGVGIAQANNGFAIKIQISNFDDFTYRRQYFYTQDGEYVNKGQQIFIGIMME